MLRDIRLRFWPSYFDCLRWSQSGIVAVMGSEFVHILVPAREDSKKILGSPQFEVTKANLRNEDTDNVLVNEPARIYSIGEEQGPGYVKAIEWSPIGTSWNRGCMLVVLTTTHKLKIFEAHGHASNSWRLAMNVSDAMDVYDGWGDGTLGELSKAEISRLRSRTRSIAWSLACEYEDQLWGQSLLVVSNDNREIVFIHVRPQECRIVHTFKPDIRQSPGYYPKLALSPWKIRSKTVGESFLTLANGGRVVLYKAVMALQDDDNVQVSLDVQNPILVGHAVTDIHPILDIKWYEKEIDGYNILVYAIQRYLRVVALKFDTKGSKNIQVWEYENGYIDPVSGLIITPGINTEDAIDIHLSTVLGHTQIITWNFAEIHDLDSAESSSKTRVMDTSNCDPPRNSIQQSWDYVIHEKNQDFIAEWDLNSATCKIWGLAGSPLGSIVAAVISSEPDDALQYITHSKETSRLVFGTQLWGEDFVKRTFGRKVLPPVTKYTAENFILECANLEDAEATPVETASELPKMVYQSLKVTLQAHACKDLTRNVTINPRTTSSALLASLSRSMYSSSTLNALRYLTCLRLFPQSRRQDGSPIIPLQKSEPLIIAALVTNIIEAARLLAPTDELSRKIVYSAACVGMVGLWQFQEGVILSDCLQVFESLMKADPKPDLTSELKFLKNMMTLKKQEKGVHGVSDDERAWLGSLADKLTRCELCDGEFRWDDMLIAECSGGHRYARCSITFMPMQSGRHWKTCMICERIVMELKEDKGNPETNKGELEPGSSCSTLLDILLKAWDICVHCGGRFR